MTAPALPWIPAHLAMDGTSDDVADAVATRDARLVEAALADPNAYRHLVTLHQARVYATALRLLGSEADAHDVSQEAFLRAYKALARFQKGRRFGPWVCTITANAARDLLRDPVRRFLRFGLLQRETMSHERSGHRLLEDEEQRDALAAQLMKLKPKLREAVVLRFVSDMSVEEVAVALGIGESAAKMRIKRALEQLEALAAHDR